MTDTHNTQHTPGPWDRGENWGDPNDGYTIRGGNDSHIADVYGRHHPDDIVSAAQGLANARLIAAAPDLLAALESLLYMYGDSISARLTRHIEAWEDARSAVKAATGETI